MTAPPMVSVAMPVSRQASVVRRALESVLAQDLGDFEILIGDETGEIEALVAQMGDPRIDYRKNPQRLGFTLNHRAVLDRAQGRYVAILHDDDWWEPTYLSSLVGVMEAQPGVGMACCTTVLSDDRGESWVWPIPVKEGRTDDVVNVLLHEDWFLLPISTVWRASLWAGPVRQWPELRCSDLHLFLAIAEAGWSLFYLEEPLAHWSQHHGQSGAWRGSDNGLGVANDTLAFWEGWLQGRSEEVAERVSRQRARWYLRQARALLLDGRGRDSRAALRQAAALARDTHIDRGELPGLLPLSLATRLPARAVRAAVGLKRVVTERR